MTGTRAKSALILVVACLLLTGCKSAATDPAGAAAPAAPTTAPASNGAAAGGGAGGSSTVACDLVSEDDATTAIGSPAGPATRGGTPALSECIYGDGALLVGMNNQGKTFYDNARAQAGSKVADVPGVGDAAFEVGGGQNATLEFYKGSSLVSLILASTNPSPRDSIIALAKSAAARI